MPGTEAKNPGAEFIHIRQRSPGEFDRYTTQEFGKGVKARLGWKGGKSEVQVLLFDKDKYSEDQAKAWVKGHKEYHLAEAPVCMSEDAILTAPEYKDIIDKLLNEDAEDEDAEDEDAGIGPHEAEAGHKITYVRPGDNTVHADKVLEAKDAHGGRAYRIGKPNNQNAWVHSASVLSVHDGKGKQLFSEPDEFIEFGEEDLSSPDMPWYEIVREGEYRRDAVTGKGIKITAPMLSEYKKNYEANVRGMWFDEDKTVPTLDIDYEHKKDPAKGKKAAGWFGELDIRPSSKDAKKKSLYMRPMQFTSDALDAIKKGEYKGFSVEITKDYMDDDSGKTFSNVLLGGGLTNRPQVHDMIPLSAPQGMSEDGGKKSKKEATKMLLTEVAAKHKIALDETDTDETIADKLDEKLTKTQSTLDKMLKEKLTSRRVLFIASAKGKLPPVELEEGSDTLAEFDRAPDYMEKMVEKLPVHPEFKEKPKGKEDAKKDGKEPDEDDKEFDELPSESKVSLTKKYMSEHKMFKPEQFSEAADMCRTEYNEKWQAKQLKKESE